MNEQIKWRSWKEKPKRETPVMVQMGDNVFMALYGARHNNPRWHYITDDGHTMPMNRPERWAYVPDGGRRFCGLCGNVARWKKSIEFDNPDGTVETFVHYVCSKHADSGSTLYKLEPYDER